MSLGNHSKDFIRHELPCHRKTNSNGTIRHTFHWILKAKRTTRMPFDIRVG